MVVRRVLSNVARELRDLDVRLEVPFEAAKKDLALPRLEAVEHGRDAPLEVLLALLRRSKKGSIMYLNKKGSASKDT